MNITVKFFVTYRDLTGVDTLELSLDETATIADLLAQIERDYPQLQEKFRKQALIAVNEKYAHRKQGLHEGDVVALFPPVSGG